MDINKARIFINEYKLICKDMNNINMLKKDIVSWSNAHTISSLIINEKGDLSFTYESLNNKTAPPSTLSMLKINIDNTLSNSLLDILEKYKNMYDDMILNEKRITSFNIFNIGNLISFIDDINSFISTLRFSKWRVYVTGKTLHLDNKELESDIIEMILNYQITLLERKKEMEKEME